MEVFKKNINFDHFLASLGFSWPHFLFLLVFTLNLSMHCCNEGEEEEPYFALRID